MLTRRASSSRALLVDSTTCAFRAPTLEFVEVLLREWQRTARKETFCTRRTDAWTGAAHLARLSCAWRTSINEWRDLQIEVTLESPDDAACFLLARCSQLRSIELLSCQCLGMRYDEDSDPNVNDDTSLQAVLQSCLQLESLTLHNGKFPNSLFALDPPALSRLLHIKLHNCYQLTGAAVIEIARRCPQLKSLEVCGLGPYRSEGGHLTDEMIATVAALCPQLEAVQLSHCPSLTVAAIRSLVTCEHLARLDMRHGSDVLPTAEAVALIGRSCPQLRALILSPRCSRPSTKVASEDSFDAALREVGRGCPMLTELDVSDWPLAERTVIEIASRCPNLEVLALPEASATDVAMEAVGTHCCRLRSLQVVRGSLTDAGLSRLVARCPRLEELHLTYCRHVSGIGLRAVAAHCKDLKVLVAYGCSGEGRDRAVDEILAECKQLTVCRY